MKLGQLSYVIIGALLLNQLPLISANAATSPEDQCFDLLRSAASANPAFNTLDLSKVRKTNGKNNTLKSGTFSVATYDDFMDAFNTPVPYFQSDIVNYPDEMNKVPTRYKFIPTVHKSNRNNTASIIYNNGVKTKIDHWMSKDGSSTGVDIQDYFAGKASASSLDSKHHRQKIDGYYLDSHYVTFGAESDLDFSYPNRAANPADDDYYPTGRPVKDMRQYLIYMQHLKPELGGDLLSCELIKMVPQNPYKLKDFNYTGKSLNWVNYGGTKMSESNAKTSIVGGGKFRKAEIDYTTTVRNDANKKLLRFHAISINYDNKNSFLNTFITSEFFNEAMRDALNASQTFNEMRRAFYNKIIASGMGIGQGSTGGAPNDSLLQGGWCGLKITSTNSLVQPCQGLDPELACPSGYKKGNWANLGDGPWITCFQQNTSTASVSPPEHGLWCGIKMTGDTSRMVRCDNLDPQNACPDGYQSKKFAAMGSYNGDWYTCYKENNSDAVLIPSGAWCGLKMAQHPNPIRTCDTYNPQVSCPEGYSSRQWANINSEWGRWFSCFKESSTPTATEEMKHFDLARVSLPGLKLSGKATYYAPDQATADQVCTVYGQQTGKGFSKGEWTGGTDTAKAPGWSYSNLAIRGWDTSTGVYDICTTGFQCSNQSVEIRNKLKCMAY